MMKHSLLKNPAASQTSDIVRRIRQFFPLCLVACFAASDVAGAEREAPFSLVIGTQAIGTTYQLSDGPLLLEMAGAIRDLGSDTLKISVSPSYPKHYRIERNPDFKSALDLVSKDPSYKAALDMPFRNIMLWLYPFSDTKTKFRTGKFKPGEADQIYREIYDFTAYLLTTYSGTGKSFFIGNWEGDWHTFAGRDKKGDPKPEILEGMREWFLLREKAVADARRNTPHHGVNVYFYVEINQVAKAMREGRPALVNKVLPHIKTDYVSYSSYDVTNVAMKVGGDEGRQMLFEALDYIERHLPESDVPGKRVMIGEYGVTYRPMRDPEIQRRRSAELMRWGLEWGCPFILYWQLYCNEAVKPSGANRGYWLIDNKGVKQPVWHLHHDFLEKANSYVDDYQRRNGRLPDQAEYLAAAKNWIKAGAPDAPAQDRPKAANEPQ